MPEQPFAAVWRDLDRFLTFERDWNSYDSDPISPVSVAGAKRLLLALHATHGALVEQGLWVAPLADGGVDVEWTHGAEELLVTVSDQGTLGYLWATRIENGHIFHDEGDGASTAEVSALFGRIFAG